MRGGGVETFRMIFLLLLLLVSAKSFSLRSRPLTADVAGMFQIHYEILFL